MMASIKMPARSFTKTPAWVFGLAVFLAEAEEALSVGLLVLSAAAAFFRAEVTDAFMDRWLLDVVRSGR